MKTYVILASTLAVALAAAAFLSLPRAVQAAAVALIRDNDNPGRHNFSASCVSGSDLQVASCKIALPPNEEVVIRNVAFLGSSQGNDALMQMQISYMSASGTLYPIQAMASRFGAGEFPVTQPTWFAVDPSVGSIACVGFLSTASTAGLTCTVTGYYVTLP